MDSNDFFEGLKSKREQDQQWTDSAEFFVNLKRPEPGHEKLAFGLAMKAGTGDSQSWISQFEGSPLLEQAIALERQELQFESEDLARRQQQRAEGDARMQAEQQLWDQRDELRLQKKQLELQLAEQQLGGGQPVMKGDSAADLPRDTGPSAQPELEAGATAGGGPGESVSMSPGLPKQAGALKRLLEKRGYEIQPSERTEIPKKDFAQPSKEEAGHEGKYPIPDRQHARSALGFAKMHHDSGALAAVKEKVEQKYPDMLKSAAPAGARHAVSEALGKIRGHLTPENIIPAAAGGVFGGGLTLHSAIPRKGLEGKSRGEVASSELARGEKKKDRSEMGFSRKLVRNQILSAPDLAQSMREHPAKATALGAAVGGHLTHSVAKPLRAAIMKLRAQHAALKV